MSRKLVAFLSALLLAAALGAQDDPAHAVKRFSLENGLQVFVLENPSSPLVRVQLAFRSGSSAQTADNAGIVSLHAALMFRGCEKYPSQADVAAALASIGAVDRGSAVDGDSAIFYSLQPAQNLGKALDFWAAAFQKPLFDPSALEAARKEMLDAIGAGSPANPVGKLFASYPWRRDPSGSAKTAGSITAEALKAFHAAYCVPGNAALFIAGKVKADDALALAKASFGGWASAPDPWEKPPRAHPTPGVKRPTFVIEKDPALQAGFAKVSMFYRGPDLSGSAKARTGGLKAAAEALLWKELMNDPAGPFVTHMTASLGPGSSAAVDFLPERDASVLVIRACSPLAKPESAWRLAMLGVKEQVRGAEIETMRKNASGYFGSGALAKARPLVASGLQAGSADLGAWILSLGKDWAAGGTQWAFGKADLVADPDWDDISAFADEWIAKNLEVVVLSVSPDDYDAAARNAKIQGFDTVEGMKPWWSGR